MKKVVSLILAIIMLLSTLTTVNVLAFAQTVYSAYFTGDELQFEFTAENSGVYQFSVEGLGNQEDNDYESELEIYDIYGNRLRGIFPQYGQTAALYLNQDETVKLTYNDYNCINYEFDLIIEEYLQYILGSDEMNVLPEQKIYFRANGAEDDSSYKLYFIPDETGIYSVVKPSSNAFFTISQVDSDLFLVCNEGNDSITYVFNNGETYEIDFGFYGNDSELVIYYGEYSGGDIGNDNDIDFSNAPDIFVDESVDVNINNAGYIRCFRFIPEEDGDYTFYSTSGEELSSDDDSGTDRNFKINYYLNAGETYYFGSKFWSSDSTGNFQVTLTQENISEVEAIDYKSNSPLKEGIDNLVAKDENGNYYNHYYSKCSVGDIFTINYKDVSSVVYIACFSNGDSNDSNKHIHFVSENEDIIECGFEKDELQIGYGDSEIYENLYSVGENTTIARYMGVKTEFNFTIEPTDIVNFKVTPISSTIVSLKYDESSTNGYYDYPPFTVDVTYSDGRTERIECNNSEDIYENSVINLFVEDDQGEWINDEYIAILC